MNLQRLADFSGQTATHLKTRGEDLQDYKDEQLASPVLGLKPFKLNPFENKLSSQRFLFVYTYKTQT